MQTLNFISGLGADERVFSHLNINGYDQNYITWLEPFKNETVENYARRLSLQIDTAKTNILVCVSFGGIIGIELSKLIKFEKIIIISSVKNKYEIPVYYRITGKLKLYRLLPGAVLKSYNSIIAWCFGVENQNEKELLKSIFKDTDKVFLKWAISKITGWKSTARTDNLFHIHGTCDRLFPVRYVKDCIKVDKGQHFMIVSKADEISKIINDIIGA